MVRTDFSHAASSPVINYRPIPPNRWHETRRSPRGSQLCARGKGKYCNQCRSHSGNSPAILTPAAVTLSALSSETDYIAIRQSSQLRTLLDSRSPFHSSPLVNPQRVRHPAANAASRDLSPLYSRDSGSTVGL